VSVDGKRLRNSGVNGQKGFIHMVSAWCNTNNMVLGQVKTDEKSNEITAIPALLDLLMLKGAVVTIDAMGCQQQIAEKIVDRKADYVLAVKENQGHLLDDIEAAHVVDECLLFYVLRYGFFPCTSSPAGHRVSVSLKNICVDGD
jgi:predicted transposase YbfD/YdcC